MICLAGTKPATFILVSDPRKPGAVATTAMIGGEWKWLLTECELFFFLKDAQHVGKMHEMINGEETEIAALLEKASSQLLEAPYVDSANVCTVAAIMLNRVREKIHTLEVENLKLKSDKEGWKIAAKEYAAMANPNSDISEVTTSAGETIFVFTPRPTTTIEVPGVRLSGLTGKDACAIFEDVPFQSEINAHFDRLVKEMKKNQTEEKE
jgi:hypothetical protein